ncbi:MAG: hypothetical protein KF764_13610 [Labilithrix sp.]|nr:hypothetical protein [Labilithrix sp.]MBX3221687.1 hypothetical protein [Labilithrix sp.]
MMTLIAGCGGSDPPPAQQPQAYNGQYPQQQPGYPQQQPGYPQQQPGYPQQQPGYPQQQPGPQPGQDPNAQPNGGGFQIPGLPGQQPAASGGGSAQALDPNLAQLAVAPLTVFANTEAPGMTKEGATIAGNFQEGQTLESAFTFQPGKCYTVVAVGAGIQNIDIEMQYVTPLPGIAPSIAKDSQTGAQASIGGKGNCLKPISPFPANAKFIVRAAKGAGVAAAQLYVK